MLFPKNLIAAALLAWVPAQALAAQEIVAFKDGFDEIIAPDADIKQLASGFLWSEGPVWDKKRNRLYFTDVPDKKIYSWSEEAGLSVFLSPSGRTDGSGEGANGLIISASGEMIVPNHGTRTMESMNINTKERRALATMYQGKRFSSPNDVVETSSGDLLFTDPPYGLKGLDGSPDKETSFNGVYRLSASGEVTLIDRSLTRPNGIVLSPDEQTLYVTVSDPAGSAVHRYTMMADGTFGNRELFFDAMPYFAEGLQGLPDGMAVSTAGHLAVTGPGGVFILAPSGEVLGQVRLPDPTANCTFGPDGALYITSNDKLYVVKTKLTGLGFDD